MNRGKALAKNTLIISFGTFLPKLAGVIVLPIITSELTKAEYGTYDLVSTLVLLFLPVVTLQVQMAAFRYLIDCRGDERRTKSIVSTILAFIVPMSVVSLTLLYLALGLPRLALPPLTRLQICGYFFFDILLLTLQQTLRGLDKNKLYSVSAVVRAAVNMLLVVLTVSGWHQGLTGALMSLMIAAAVGLLVVLLGGHIFGLLDLRLVNRATLKELLNYSWPLIPNALSNWVLSFSDRAVLTAVKGLEAVAVYGAACKIPALFSVAQSTFVFAWQENASIALGDEDASKYYTRMFDEIFRILVGIMAGLIAAAPLLFRFFVRGDYADSYPHMPILFMAMLFSSVASFMSGIYVAHKRTRNVGITTMVAAGINLLIDLACVRWIGIYAASLSTLISYFALALYRMLDAKRFQPMQYHWPRILLMLAGLTLMCVLNWMNRLPTDLVNVAVGPALALTANWSLLGKMKGIALRKLGKLKKRS